MITAKRNKAGNIEINGTWHIFSTDKKNRMVFKADDCELDIPIEEEREDKPLYMGFNKTELDKIHRFIMDGGVEKNKVLETKFVPNRDELLKWGFVETTWKTYFANGDKTILYSQTENKLFQYAVANNIEIPFHTKADFLKAIGVEEKEKPFDKSRNGGVEYYKANEGVNDYEKATYIPSESLLQELGFKCESALLTNPSIKVWEFKFNNQLFICYDCSNQFLIGGDYHGKLFLRSDSELRMLVEVLGREK